MADPEAPPPPPPLDHGPKNNKTLTFRPKYALECTICSLLHILKKVAVPPVVCMNYCK